MKRGKQLTNPIKKTLGILFCLAILTTIVTVPERKVHAQSTGANSYKLSIQGPLPNMPSTPVLIGQLCGSATKKVYPIEVEVYGFTQNMNTLQLLVSKSTHMIDGGTAQVWTGLAPAFDSSAPVISTAKVQIFTMPMYMWSSNPFSGDGIDIERSFLNISGFNSVTGSSTRLDGSAQQYVLNGVNECIDVSVDPLTMLSGNSYAVTNFRWDEK